LAERGKVSGRANIMEFKYDIRDLKFILKEWLNTEEVLNCERFKEYYSIDDIDPLINEGYKIAKEVVNPINTEGDKIGVKFEDGVVTPAPGYKEAFKFLQENGWGSSSEAIEQEGGMPLILFKAIHEMNTGACPALTSYIKLSTGVANLLIDFATPEIRDKFLPNLLNGEWQGTMCLTEPNAGSDVPDITTRAYATDDPYIYKIKGTKMFITGGDHGLCSNTIHAVLAKPEGAAPGSAGIGLYIVPKYWVNDDGSLGRYNDVATVTLEHKMGLKAQATALLNFGEEDECYGYMLGSPPDEKGRSRGLAMMFNMMNESRIGTGHNANCQSAAAYYFAAQYATERIQGRPFGDKNPNAQRVPIINHEDIRRMLLDMKAHTEGIRAMIFKGFWHLDIENNSSDKEKAKRSAGIAAVLTPLVKCYGSECAVNLISEAIQVLGGVGYTQEYPVEQYLRDSKILTIWEGTSFIHGQDLVTRKMRMQDGVPFANWLEDIKTTIDANAADFAAEAQAVQKAYDCVVAVKKQYDSWYDKFADCKNLIPLYSIRALFVCAMTQVAACLLEQAAIARKKLAELPADHFEVPFYSGKIASAKYYIKQVLPAAYMYTDLITSADTSVLECPIESLVLP
jgi:alkylation response protein AidB-like acyl-CoA dehydrogenase